VLVLILLPLPVAGDAGRDAALRALRDRAGAIQTWVESAERPAWLNANPHDGARVAGEALGLQQLGRFREGVVCRGIWDSHPTVTGTGKLRKVVGI
jgi:hypothetical protein